MSEIQLTYNLLRASLNGETARMEGMDASHWWRLFRLMQQNHVAALTANTVAATDVPREVKMPWLAECGKAMRWHRYQREVQDGIVEVMKHHGIDTLVLKGTHTARHYPIPETREFGDLDFYFYDRHDEADRVARKALKVEVSNDAHHHSKYNYRGVTVESHYDFLNTHYPPSNRRYEALLKGLCPSPTFEVLFLLRHMAGHFAASRITLRDLVDWTLTCRALERQADWNRVQQAVADYGMSPFVNALNTVAKQQLGIALPMPHDEEADTTLFERDIVYGSAATDDKHADGLARLGWKLRRWRALGWKRRMVYCDSTLRLALANLTSHALKPKSFLHKQ